MKIQIENEKLKKEKNQIAEELNILKNFSESDRKQLTELKEKDIENMADNEIMKNKIENLCNEKGYSNPNPYFSNFITIFNLLTNQPT